MLIQVDKFKEVITKATINFSIESVQLNFTPEEIRSKMISFASDAIALLKIKNEVLPGISDEIQFNFVDPNSMVMPYLNLIEGETIVKIGDEKVSLLTGNQTSNLYFCAPSVVNTLSSDGPKMNLPLLHEVAVDEKFNTIFDKIKKVGPRFDKIYFGVDKGKFYIETTDKTNKFSNGLRIVLDDCSSTDVSLCFTYRNVFSLMSILSDNFKLYFYYVKENNLGMLKATNADESELYFLMSKKEG